jgi:hypothetical protein
LIDVRFRKVGKAEAEIAEIDQRPSGVAAPGGALLCWQAILPPSVVLRDSILRIPSDRSLLPMIGSLCDVEGIG